MSLLVPNASHPSSADGKTGGSFSLTFKLQPGERLIGLCQRMACLLREREAAPLHMLVYGRAGAEPMGVDALKRSFGGIAWPVTWVEGADCSGKPVAGIQIYAFTGRVGRIERHGRVVGSVFTEGGARQCLVGGLTPPDHALPRDEQTRLVLEEYETVLALGGFDLADTVRTWFFLENILDWYNDFNRARTAIYSGVKFHTGSLPASTGVGAANPTGTAIAFSAWAFRSLEKNTKAGEVSSPLQCPAPAYGSSFSRAMQISTGHNNRLFISGTASIAPDGGTLHVGDTRRQLELSMDVIEAILRSRGYVFEDLTRATAYFRNATDAGLFFEWLAANGLTHVPVVTTQCDVCRDDLLFEVEAEAERAL